MADGLASGADTAFSVHKINLKTVKVDVDYYLHTDNPPHIPAPIRIYSLRRRQAVLTANVAVEEKAAFVSSYI